MRLENRTILITRGSSGIGFELAKRLLQRAGPDDQAVTVTSQDPQGRAGNQCFLERCSHPFSHIAGIKRGEGRPSLLH